MTRNWIYAPLQDIMFILMPPFVVLLVLLILPSEFLVSHDLTDYQWLWLVLAVDVAHVYTTLFRTYFDKEERKYYGSLFWLVPLVCFAAGVFLYALGDFVFWRVIAYMAVFHFIRQQYGFMRLYSRGEEQEINFFACNADSLRKEPKIQDRGFKERLLNSKALGSVSLTTSWLKKFDVVVIYLLTLYPMYYWHSHDRNFVWFTEKDFFEIEFNDFGIPLFVYCVVIVLYCIKEVFLIVKNKRFNIGRNAVILGTGLSWYFGIVYFNGDLAFTALNVISHGIPYMALVWFYKKKEDKPDAFLNKAILIQGGWLILITMVLLLAYAEEALWDGLVWQEHAALFPFVKPLSDFDFASQFVWLVPLLSLPQVTHYILDGFIWKKKK